MEKFKNDQCAVCAHAVVCKYISAYDKTIEALNGCISNLRPLYSELPEGFRIRVYCPLLLLRASPVPKELAK